MNAMRTLVAVLVVGAMTAAAGAAAVKMPDLAPADSQAVIEAVDLAGLRQMVLDSKFWAALEGTEAFKEWLASDKHAKGQQQLEAALQALDMNLDTALKTYMGGRCALVLLKAEEGKKPDGVFITEAMPDLAQYFAESLGGQPAQPYRDIPIWEIKKDDRTDRVAVAGGVMLISGAKGNALEHVLDVVAGQAAPLSADKNFKKVTAGLPALWGVRAYAAKIEKIGGPGAVAAVPTKDGWHLEWRMIESQSELATNAPAVLSSPNILPAGTVAAIATVFHPQAIWDAIKVKAAASDNPDALMQQAEGFMQLWFPEQPIDAILKGVGPEAAVALVKGEDGGPPALVAVIKLAAGGRPVAEAFKKGLAAKVRFMAAMSGQKAGEKPKLAVREEAYGDASLLVVDAPALLQGALGDWAKDVALTVAVTDDWFVAGTSPAAVKQTLDTAAGKVPGFAAALKDAGQAVPAGAVTRWGIVQPAGGADVVLSFAERLAGKDKIDEAKKLANLAELLKLITVFSWQRVDTEDMVIGKADLVAGQ